MIIGGTNAAGKAGGLRCGYSESYLPCSVRVVNRRILEAIERDTAETLVWRASARIMSLSGTWIDLGSASYFQITRNSAGDLDSADLTLQQPEIWSPYLTTYPDLLRPSNRLLQIRAGLVIDGRWYSTVVFAGHIKNYSEAIGGSGGGISLRLEDARDIASRTPPATSVAAKASVFRAMLAQQASVAQFGTSGAVVRIALKDRVLESYVLDQSQVGSVISAMVSHITGFPLLQITGSGSLKVAQEQTSEALRPAFAYSDKNIHIATRRMAGDEQCNVVKVYGLVNGVGTAGEVQDAADVAKRGRIVYGAGFIGSPTTLYSDAATLAAEHIAASLRGLIDLEIPFNPYLSPGMAISLASSRLGISPAKTGKVYEIRHQYSVGRCRSYLTGLKVY